MRILVPASLLVSFAANDGEELVTMSSMPSMVADVLSRLPAPLRSLAGSRLKTLTLSRRHVQVGVATMGVLFGVAVLDGCAPPDGVGSTRMRSGSSACTPTVIWPPLC